MGYGEVDWARKVSGRSQGAGPARKTLPVLGQPGERRQEPPAVESAVVEFAGPSDKGHDSHGHAEQPLLQLSAQALVASVSCAGNSRFQSGHKNHNGQLTRPETFRDSNDAQFPHCEACAEQPKLELSAHALEASAPVTLPPNGSLNESEEAAGSAFQELHYGEVTRAGKLCHAAGKCQEHACDACVRTTSLATLRPEAIGGSRRDTLLVSTSSHALVASAFVPEFFGLSPAGSFVRDTDARAGAKQGLATTGELARRGRSERGYRGDCPIGRESGQVPAADLFNPRARVPVI